QVVQCGVVYPHLRTFILGDNPCVSSGGADLLASSVDVTPIAGEGDGHVVQLKFGGQAYVFVILFREAGCRNAAAAPIDAFVVGQGPAHHDGGVNRMFLHAVDVEHDPAVVQQ